MTQVVTNCCHTTVKGNTNIDAAADLDDALGHRFILVAGSAISGVAFPYLPMSIITKTIMRFLEIKITGASYYDHLYASYARRLADGYGHILSDTLFEEFLGELIDASNRETLNTLLKQLYSCKGNDFGPNHEAVARLLQAGRCCACFTTNFDNAIEMACRSIGLNLRVWDVIERQSYPGTLPGEAEDPILVKMHGSVTNDTCVAESREILDATSNVRHGPLEHLLKDRGVFVVGYSGTGDIDITRHFKRKSTRFLVARHTTAEPLPTWSERRVICDLSSLPISSTPNLLRQLAGLDPASLTEHPKPRCADNLIKGWIKSATLDTKRLIRSLLKWRKADTLLHLNHADRQNCHSGVLGASDGLLHLQRGAYRTALRIYENLPIDNQPIERVLEAKSGQAFAQWRSGRWKRARETLASLLPLVEYLVMQGCAFSNKSVEERCFNVCRVYIEVCVDDLQLMPLELAGRAAREWNIDVANELLKQLRHPNPQDQLLAQIADCQVEWIAKRDGNIIRVGDLFRDCMDRQYLNSAWVATRLALQVSFKIGLCYYGVLNNALRNVQRRHYIWKNRESLFTALATRPRAKREMLRYLFAKGVLTLLYSMRTAYVELRHKHEVSRWTAQQQKWKQLGHIT